MLRHLLRNVNSVSVYWRETVMRERAVASASKSDFYFVTPLIVIAKYMLLILIAHAHRNRDEISEDDSVDNYDLMMDDSVNNDDVSKQS